jgi:hypothetical protein
VHGPGVKREAGLTTKPVKSLVDPVFLQNLDFACAELAQHNRESFAAAFHLAQEIARDAYDYSLAPPTIASRGQAQVPAQARAIMYLCEALYAVKADDYHGAFNLQRAAQAVGADWLLTRTCFLQALGEAAVNSFEDHSEAAAFKAQEDEHVRELEGILAANAGQDTDGPKDEAEDVLNIPDEDEDAASMDGAAAGGGTSKSRRSLFGGLGLGRASAASKKDLATPSKTKPSGKGA